MFAQPEIIYGDSGGATVRLAGNRLGRISHPRLDRHQIERENSGGE
ncbi:hypothetical protein [Xenorhabdus sp. Sc-CR9]|nr:hypothetical protein [Xenorhabdus sp. Sc-CR9]